MLNYNRRINRLEAQLKRRIEKSYKWLWVQFPLEELEEVWNVIFGASPGPVWYLADKRYKDLNGGAITRCHIALYSKYALHKHVLIKRRGRNKNRRNR